MKRVALFCTASIEVITLFCHGFQIDATYSSLGGQMWCRPIYLERGCLQVVTCSKVKIQKSSGGQTPRLGTCYPSAVCRDAWEICSLACGTWWDIYGRSVVGSVVESCNFAQCKLTFLHKPALWASCTPWWIIITNSFLYCHFRSGSEAAATEKKSSLICG